MDDVAKTTHHQAFLELVSEGMICSSRTEHFMEWVCRYLVRYMKSTHISIALYDPLCDAFPVEVSTGNSRIPPRLVALNRANSIVQWFQPEMPSQHFVRRSNRIMSLPDFKHDPESTSSRIKDEMRRHRVEVCAKIQTSDRLAGYLLIGPRENGVAYNREDLSLFQVLANDIAVEIEKESYYDLSHFDPLTGLLNRNTLEKKFTAWMNRSAQTGEEFAVGMLDLDNFKKINDQFGHLAGDQVLKITAKIIRTDLRQSDVAFRYGGEEFLVLLRMNSRDPARTIENREFHVESYHVVDRLRKRIDHRPVKYLSHVIPVTTSIGLTFYSREMKKNYEELIQEADQALYASKQNGKNIISVYPYI